MITPRILASGLLTSLAVLSVCCMAAEPSRVTRPSGVQARDYELQLKQTLRVFQQPAETMDDLRAALHSPYTSVRQLAIRLFNQREGKAFVPTLKGFLADEDTDIRITAASLLAGLDDRSGLEPMVAVLQEVPVPSDPQSLAALNLTKLRQALNAGAVLAQLGDDSAYSLAAAALKYPVPAIRDGAVEVLGQIGASSRDPGARERATESLVRHAGEETDKVVQTGVSAAARKLAPELAARVHRALAASPRTPPWLRNFAEKEKAAAEGAPPPATSRPSSGPKRLYVVGTRPAQASQPATRPAGSSRPGN